MCMDYGEGDGIMEMDVTNPSLALYDVSESILKESVRVMSTLLRGVTHVFVNNISALPLAIVIADILSLPPLLHEKIDNLIHEIILEAAPQGRG